MGDPGLSSSLKHSCIEVRSLGTPRKSICRLAEGSPQLEGDSLAGARFIEMNWGREKERREPFSWRDKRKRKREGLRKYNIELAQAENLSGPWTV